MSAPFFDRLGGRLGGGSSQIFFIANEIRVYAITSAYIPDYANDEFLSAVADAAILGSAVLGSKIYTPEGIFKAADSAITGVTGICSAFLFAMSTGVKATSPLICLLGAPTYTGLPTANLTSQTINIAWPAAGIFRIGS